MEKLAERFWKRVKTVENGCMEWQGYVTRNGYGQVGHENKVLYAHRVSWMLTHSDPSEAYVLHKCDNRRCVNPDHLFLGLFQDNMDDMVGKKRHPYGEKNGHAKVTADQVREIRASKERTTDLAKRYGVALSTISVIRGGTNWSHL